MSMEQSAGSGTKTKLWQVLGYLGLLPFLGAAILITTQTSLFGLKAEQLFTYYSAVILSFLAGTLWMQSHSLSKPIVLVVSNVFSLLAFSALLVPVTIGLPLLMLSFIGLLVFELKNDSGVIHSPSYRTMRVALTSIVVLLHCFVIVSLMS